MARALREILRDEDRATALAASGLDTVLSRHTCAHRVDELFTIVASVRPAFAGRALAR
jgi:spore maturation protein CgeB